MTARPRKDQSLLPELLRPWRLPPNRVSRFYRGGALLERFRGGALGPNGSSHEDGSQPEDWVGSATAAWTPPESPATGEGLGVAEIDGRTHRIVDLLDTDPPAVAGAELVAAAGTTTGLLVKLLDAAARLPIHAHPSRAFARRWLRSWFGKAEAWIVLATRETGGLEGPVVHIGFRRDVGREELIDLIADERTSDLLDAMHVKSTGPGDVWFIPAGVPHAIGAGVFMVEIEEPSDFSIVAETADVPIHPATAHLGLGWEVAVDAVDRAGHDDAWLDGLRHDGRRAAETGDGWTWEPLLDSAADPYFRAGRLAVDGRAAPQLGPPSYLVGIVTRGRGAVRAGAGDLRVRAGETFAIPAGALADVEIDAPQGIEVIVCLPPRAGDLVEMPA
jgi:mannose-6-phosphate isomerase